MARHTTLKEQGALTVRQTSFPFLKLPLELRNMIYAECVLNLGFQFKVQWLNHRRETARSMNHTKLRELQAPLSMTSKAVRIEYKSTEKIVRKKNQSLETYIHVAEHLKETRIRRSALVKQTTLPFDKIRHCTIAIRVHGWHDEVNVDGLSAFMSLPIAAKEIHFEIHCPPDTPLHEQWIANASILRNNLEWRIKRREQRVPAQFRDLQLLPASVDKLSICLRTHINGKPCKYYMFHAERKIISVKGQTSKEMWERTKPEAEAGQTVVEEWSELRVYSASREKYWKDTIGPPRKDERFSRW